MGSPDRDDGFAAFFKRYTKTWQHALATAGLTAFGTLTFVNRLFAVLAILAYVLPPIVLYVRGSRPARSPTPADSDPDPDVDSDSRSDSDSDSDSHSRPDSGSVSDPEPTDEPAPGRSPDFTPEDEGESESEGPVWTAANAPTEQTLFDAVVVGGSAYAVGAEGSVLAAGDSDPADSEWVVAVADGPRAQSNTLRGVDAVAGGGVWFAGDGEAVGRLDPTADRHVDHSAPEGDTTNVVDVAAAGSPGDETVLLVDGSGRVRRGRYRDGEVAWDAPVTPGGGSSLAGIALVDASAGYACDTNQRVYETGDRGQSFGDAGLDAAQGTLTGVAATDPGRCAVSADDGVVHRYGDGTWTPERLDDGPLWALALDGERGLASGDSGVVYQRLAAGGTGWDRTLTPASGPLRGVALGPSRAVAVGADGAVVECALSADAGGS
jgi:hypothetical protein